jgi:rhodanese-related sulfurtransferase
VIDKFRRKPSDVLPASCGIAAVLLKSALSRISRYRGKSLEPSFLVFLQKSPFNMVLFGTAVVTGGMLVWPAFGRLAGSAAPQVGAFEAVNLINRRDAIIIDVREKTDYAAGHIPNSQHIPLADLAHRLGELEKFKARPVLVNCAPGNAAAKVCTTLTQAGFKEVFALRGGMNGWVEASLPVEK